MDKNVSYHLNFLCCVVSDFQEATWKSWEWIKSQPLIEAYSQSFYFTITGKVTVARFILGPPSFQHNSQSVTGTDRWNPRLKSKCLLSSCKWVLCPEKAAWWLELFNVSSPPYTKKRTVHLFEMSGSSVVWPVPSVNDLPSVSTILSLTHAYILLLNTYTFFRHIYIFF